jgi:prepilin-type N-terminal cleavage/methylation domain-containing protein
MPSSEGRRRAGARLRSDRGFTLVELLVTASLMVVVLLAVAGIADTTQRSSQRDQARATTLAAGQAGLARMAYELRQACYIVPPGTTPTTGTYCGRASVVPAPTLCSNAALCVDFIRLLRTCVQRTAAATCPGVATTCAAPPCVTRRTQRIRYDCSLVDPANNGTTECVRFAGGACATASAGGSPSSDCGAPGRAVSPCTSSAAATDPSLIRSVLNYGSGSGLDCSTTIRPIFRYCLSTDTYTTGTNSGIACGGAPATAVAMQLSVYLARRGERLRGLANGMYLQDGITMRNIALENAP